MTPAWKEEADRDKLSSNSPSQETPLLTQQVVLLCELASIEASRLQAQMASDGYRRELKVKQWHWQQSRRELRFQYAVVQLIRELQDLLRSRPAGLVLVQVVVAHREEPSLLEALAGILKTGQQEYPKLRGQLIEIEEQVVEMAGRLC